MYKNFFKQCFLLLLVMWVVVACSQKPVQQSKTVSGYQGALDSYNTQNYNQAVSLFTEVINQGDVVDLLDEAFYYRGRSYFELANYSAAQSDFDKIIADFTANTSTVVDGALYWRGRSLHEQALLETDATAQANLFSSASEAYKLLLSAHSGSSWVDNAQFQIGKVLFDQGDFTDAVPEFQAVLALPSQGLHDIAQYYVGRSYQEEAFVNPTQVDATAFTSAVNEFAKVLTIPDPNGWRDNARYQTGRLYYDRAGVLHDGKKFAEAKADYAEAANQFSQVAVASTSYDNAIYYWAKSLHESALIDDPASTATDSEKSTNIVTAMKEARDKYLEVPAASSWKDNAQYQIGKTYYDTGVYIMGLALADNATLAKSDYEQAVTEFGKVAGLGNETAVDDAIYFTGRSHHRIALLDPAVDAASMDKARAEYTKLLSFPGGSNWHDNAQYQIGKTHGDQGNYPDAITAFEAVIAIQPVGSLHDNAYYQKGVSQYFNAYLNKAADSDKLVEYQNTVDTLDVLISDPPFANIWLDNAYYRTGLALYQMAVLQGTGNDQLKISLLADAATAFVEARKSATFYDQDEADYVLALTRFQQILLGNADFAYTDVTGLLGQVASGHFLEVDARFHEILALHNQTNQQNCNSKEADAADKFISDYELSTDAHELALVELAKSHSSSSNDRCDGNKELPQPLVLF